MKLLYCPKCKDIIKLSSKIKYCECGVSFGNYKDNVKAQIKNGIPIGIDNKEFAYALKHRPYRGFGERFDSFVIPYICPTIERL